MPERCYFVSNDFPMSLLISIVLALLTPVMFLLVEKNELFTKPLKKRSWFIISLLIVATVFQVIDIVNKDKESNRLTGLAEESEQKLKDIQEAVSKIGTYDPTSNQIVLNSIDNRFKEGLIVFHGANSSISDVSIDASMSKFRSVDVINKTVNDEINTVNVNKQRLLNTLQRIHNTTPWKSKAVYLLISENTNGFQALGSVTQTLLENGYTIIGKGYIPEKCQDAVCFGDYEGKLVILLGQQNVTQIK